MNVSFEWNPGQMETVSETLMEILSDWAHYNREDAYPVSVTLTDTEWVSVVTALLLISAMAGLPPDMESDLQRAYEGIRSASVSTLIDQVLMELVEEERGETS